MILGIDEAGRGAWAGPLVVGAVVLGEDELEGLNDSKLLSKAKRSKISEEIHASALFAGLGWVEPGEIDKLGLTAATTLGIKRAIKTFQIKGVEIIIDGNINYLNDCENSRCIVKADQSVPEVSAASIIAKVARDSYMANLSKELPLYGFDSHVGYGTKRHFDSLKKHGACLHHRLSFKPVMEIL